MSRGKRKMHTEFWWGKPKKRDQLVILGLDGIITLNASSRSGIWKYIALIWIGIGSGGRDLFNASGNLPRSLKCGKFPD